MTPSSAATTNTTISVACAPRAGGLARRPDATAAEAPGVLLAGDWVGPEGMLADAALASGRRAGLLAAGARARRRAA